MSHRLRCFENPLFRRRIQWGLAQTSLCVSASGELFERRGHTDGSGPLRPSGRSAFSEGCCPHGQKLKRVLQVCGRPSACQQPHCPGIHGGRPQGVEDSRARPGARGPGQPESRGSRPAAALVLGAPLRSSRPPPGSSDALAYEVRVQFYKVFRSLLCSEEKLPNLISRNKRGAGRRESDGLGTGAASPGLSAVRDLKGSRSRCVLCPSRARWPSSLSFSAGWLVTNSMKKTLCGS